MEKDSIFTPFISIKISLLSVVREEQREPFPIQNLVDRFLAVYLLLQTVHKHKISEVPHIKHLPRAPHQLVGLREGQTEQKAYPADIVLILLSLAVLVHHPVPF